MMIELHDYKGQRHVVAKEAIARMAEAGTSSQWHGIRTLVHLFDGKVLEISDTLDEISRKMNPPIPKDPQAIA